jgi:hypothetical protein
MKKAVLLLLFSLLLGCAATPLKTASGRPEVTIRARTIAQVRATAVNFFVDNGWAPVQTAGSQLVFEREGSAGQSFLMGMMTNNPQSKNRITLTLVENGENVRVVAGVAVIGQNTFGAQQTVELHGKGYQQLQAALETLKMKAEQKG